jgi:hypothetical protein
MIKEFWIEHLYRIIITSKLTLTNVGMISQ